MRNHIAIARIYASAHTHRAAQAAVNAKDFTVEHRAEIARLAATSAVVGVAARVAGFKAGYAFAQQS